MRNYLIFIFFITGVIFFKTLFLYFVQDDFFLLSITQIKTIGDFLTFFIPRTDVVWYRPLSSQIFFLINKTMFGINPLPYHLFMLFTHFLNIALVYLLAQKIFSSKQTSLIASLIYGVSSVHFISLSWLSTYSFIIGPTFILLTFLLYFQKKFTLALLSYILGALSNEVVLFTILPLLFWDIYVNKRTLTNLAKRILPFILATLFFIYLRLLLIPAEISGQYSFTFNPPDIISMLRFYILRFLGLPMLIRGIAFTPLGKISLSLFLVVVILGVILPLYHIKSKFDKRQFVRNIVFPVFIFLSFLLPFLFMSSHYSPHYLTFSLIGGSLYFATVTADFRKIFLVIFIVSFIILQSISVYITYNTHWLIKRAKLSRQLVEKSQLEHPVGSEEYFSLGANFAQDFFDKYQHE